MFLISLVLILGWCLLRAGFWGDGGRRTGLSWSTVSAAITVVFAPPPSTSCKQFKIQRVILPLCLLMQKAQNNKLSLFT